MKVRVLPKEASPTRFEFLRPITIVQVSANLYSKIVADTCSPYDTGL